MTNPLLTLDQVSFNLPNGNPLFTDLSYTFAAHRTGLVGRNGVGKSVLARILAGEIEPTSGHCKRTGSVYYLAQQVSDQTRQTVAELAGVKHVLDALKRIESGSTCAEDFDAVAERWDIRQRLTAELSRHQLGHLHPETPVSSLSGGEAMRVALTGAVLSEADYLVLDEPSNHLDRPSRYALVRQLQDWSKGLLVVSHDRTLLDNMDTIVELSPLGLRSYGGNYTFYQQQKAQERASAETLLEQQKLERKREHKKHQVLHDRQNHRSATNSRQAKTTNQAKILLDRNKERSQQSAAKLKQQQLAAREISNQQVREAARRVAEEAEIVLHALPAQNRHRQQIALLEDVVLPFFDEHPATLNLRLTGGQRLAVVGANGSGKSTLLKIIAGDLAPVSGHCERYVEATWLNQHLTTLLPDRTVIEQLQAVNPVADETTLRTWLAQLGLDANRLAIAAGELSGGERMKAAQALVLYAAQPPQLLLLDEPDNHLDLNSVQALEAMLNQYQGTMVVVSHDDVFLGQLGLTHRLQITPEGWQLEDTIESPS